MTPERWRRLRSAVEAALAAPPDQRERILAQMLGDDPALLADARQMVRLVDDTRGELQQPAISGAPAAASGESREFLGETLSHYRLEERLGAGGMSEVFRAVDLALGRQAAVKVVAQRLEPQLRRRLLREAETAAKLQHPAIATF
jgi:serine/threonine protein kinase